MYQATVQTSKSEIKLLETMKIYPGGSKGQEFMILCSEEEAKMILIVVARRRLDLKEKLAVKSATKYYAIERTLEKAGVQI